MAATDRGLEHLKSLITHHPNFPIDGVLFHDVAFEVMITKFVDHIVSTNGTDVDVIVGLDARGFLLGPTIAARLGCAFVPIRKAGKLPGECASLASTKEYGKDVLEIQKSAMKEGQKCVIVDDLLATGGTLVSAVELVKKVGGVPVECLCIVGLSELKGAEKVGAPCFCLFDLPAGC